MYATAARRSARARPRRSGPRPSGRARCRSRRASASLGARRRGRCRAAGCSASPRVAPRRPTARTGAGPAAAPAPACLRAPCAACRPPAGLRARLAHPQLRGAQAARFTRAACCCASGWLHAHVHVRPDSSHKRVAPASTRAMWQGRRHCAAQKRRCCCAGAAGGGRS